ncbi:MAG: arsenite methyltransferase [Candidatus Nanoarchaeia archaeon]|nr:arsenite methyltransferase [Candidatus Nanoarchaeia archaeon]
MNKEDIKKNVKESYTQVAESGCGCSCNCSQSSNADLAKSIGYSDKEINIVPESNLGLGCGNPTALGKIKEGMTVLDLGSGAGFDCFLTAEKVGKTGKVIGVDMTEKMIAKAKKNAKKHGYTNVEFRLGNIEDLPIEDNSIDVIISNCVINLSPDKAKVFKEAYRVLRKNGQMFVSDIVLLKELSETHKNNKDLISSCIGGALLKEDYLKLIKEAGFKAKILSEDREISERQYKGFPVESLKLEATKDDWRD